MKLGFHGATTMTADLQTDVIASAHAGFKTLELWAAKVDRFLVDHSLADLKALLQENTVAPMTFNSIEFIAFRGDRFGTINAEAAEELTSRLGAKVAASPEEIWAADDVDAVLIASSTNTHADLLSSAIQAQKPVYCEKPIDLNISRVKAVVQEAYQANIPILIGFSRRFDPNHLGVREAIEHGKIGKLEMMHLTARGPQPPPISYVKVSGGQFRDQTIHFFDLACWLAGEAPVEVYATGAALIDPAIGEAGDIDTSMLILKMPGGALCHIDNSRRSAYGYDERIEVFGSEGMVQSNHKLTREVTLYTGTKVISDGLHPDWIGRLGPSFALALDAFISTLEGNETTYPSLVDGLRAQMIAEAAVESLHRNQPVKITYWQPQ